MSDLLGQSAASMARAVRDREISPVELVQAHIDRAEECSDLNIVVLPRYEQALEEARAAEQALADGGVVGALHGVPFTTKECIEVAEMPCCDASKIFEGNVSTQDATVVRNLRGEGAILLGKTNIPEFAFHYDSNNLIYGATHNPHNPERSVGGSSGGEGAALATGITPIGVGSDYGGSIRVPAHFNGVTGLKPGRWVVPYGGHFPPAQAMSIQLWSEIGPMARYVDDLQLLLPIFAKPDPTTDPDVVPHRIDPDPPQGLRVAIFDDDGLCPVDPAIREAVRSAGRALADAGHEVVEERPPNQAEVREVFESIALAETIGLLWPLIEPREEELSPQIRRLLARRETLDVDLATYAGQLAYRLDLERAVAAWQQSHEIMVCPISATAAFPIGTEVLDIDGQEYEEIDLFSLSTYANAMSLPAAAVPVGRTPDGLPIGVQVIGRRYREMEVLAVAKELEEALGGWIRPELAGAAQA
ncbi:MAG TPA: amidase [Solirubrobacterales bacterium]|nr:amidase [Solirubrobacterales bacterium]